VLERFDRDRLVGGHRVSAIQVPGP
jgi:hypothetical protein